jgi:hypothetical protein
LISCPLLYVAQPAPAGEVVSRAGDRVGDELVFGAFAENLPVLAEIRLAHLRAKAAAVKYLPL